MSCPINPNVKISETDTRNHIGITILPLKTGTIRFTPLTEEGRAILKIESDRKRVSCSLDRGYEIYDWINSIGCATCEEVVNDLDSDSRFDNAGYAKSSGYDGQ